MSEIIPGLYLGAKSTSQDQVFLKKNKIARILNCAKEITSQKELQILYIPAEDDTSQDLSPYFEQASQFIHESLQTKQNVLVHCVHGVSRSATLVIAYFMMYKNMTYQKAKEMVKKKRPEICPNQGFKEQLLCLEKKQQNEKIQQL